MMSGPYPWNVCHSGLLGELLRQIVSTVHLFPEDYSAGLFLAFPHSLSIEGITLIMFC